MFIGGNTKTPAQRHVRIYEYFEYYIYYLYTLPRQQTVCDDGLLLAKTGALSVHRSVHTFFCRRVLFASLFSHGFPLFLSWRRLVRGTIFCSSVSFPGHGFPCHGVSTPGLTFLDSTYLYLCRIFLQLEKG